MTSYLNCDNLQMKIIGPIDFRSLKPSNVLWLLFLAFVFMVPISQWASVRLLVLCLIFSFFVPAKHPHFPSVFRSSWDIFLYLTVLLVGLLYSEDISLGLRVLETNFAFLALPIVFDKIKDFNKVKLHETFYVFMMGLIVASVICLIAAAVRFDGDVHRFFFNQFVGTLDFQPTYFAYYLIAAISFGLYTLYFDKNFFTRSWSNAIIAFLFLILMLTGGLTTFMSVLLILSFFVLKYALERKKAIRTGAFALVTAMLASMFAFSLIYRKLDSDLTKVTDNWERSVLWKSAISASPNYLFGVGTGDYKKVLNQFYRDHNMLAYADLSYNAHNQFIQVFFSNGFVGLACLIILLGRPFYMSVKRQYLLGALIFFPFFIYGTTEVFLGRFQGLVFFALLHQLFIVFYEKNSSYKGL